MQRYIYQDDCADETSSRKLQAGHRDQLNFAVLVVSPLLLRSLVEFSQTLNPF
jgi:hypothetical protein